jgi:3-dehydroquinate dehydratase type I
MVRHAEKERADLIEVRFDYLVDESRAKDIRGLTSLPLIATNRLPSQGGNFHGREENRRKTLLDAMETGFNLIDLEMDTPQLEKVMGQLRCGNVKLILSWHTSSPLQRGEIESKFMEMKRLGPDICKIVMTAKTMGDNLTCLDFVSKASQTNEVICFCMGSLGTVSRVLSPLFGGAFTYASTTKGKEAAPGQFTVAETKRIYELLGV